MITINQSDIVSVSCILNALEYIVYDKCGKLLPLYMFQFLVVNDNIIYIEPPTLIRIYIIQQLNDYNL